MNSDIADRYFDYAATAPPFDEALSAQIETARGLCGNPSSPHRLGTDARAELERFRGMLAAHCGFHDGRVVLMSGATEANNWVVHGVMHTTGSGRILVAADVHASVWNSCCRYADCMDVLPLDSTGRIGLAKLSAAIRADTRLVCCSHVASETGVVQDIGAIAAVCERRAIPCHVDGAQALGRIPVNLTTIACDFYTFSAHKFGGPHGCGGVFVRFPKVAPLMEGGTQENGLRPGTENLPALAGTVVALELSLAGLAAETERLRNLTRSVLTELKRSGTRFLVNGDPEKNAPGFLSLSLPGLDGHALVTDLSVQGFAIASGSACSENQPEPSRAILALGRSPVEALGTVRISFGRSNCQESVEAFARALVQTIRRQTG
jgi:cysteine desulfurase